MPELVGVKGGERRGTCRRSAEGHAAAFALMLAWLSFGRRVDALDELSTCSLRAGLFGGEWLERASKTMSSGRSTAHVRPKRVPGDVYARCDRGPKSQSEA